MSLATAVAFTEGAWLFDESAFTGTAADSSGYGNTATENGTVVVTTGMFGNAARFVQSEGDFFNGISAPNPTTEDTTIGFWIRFYNGTPVDTTSFINKFGGSGWDFTIIRNTHGTVPRRIDLTYGSGGTNSGSTLLPEDYDWHLIVSTYDGSTLTLYMDGASVGTASYSSGLAGTGYNMNINAQQASSTSAVDCDFDEVVILIDYAMDSAEVSEWWNSGAGVSWNDWAGGAAFDPATGFSYEQLVYPYFRRTDVVAI